MVLLKRIHFEPTYGSVDNAVEAIKNDAAKDILKNITGLNQEVKTEVINRMDLHQQTLKETLRKLYNETVNVRSQLGDPKTTPAQKDKVIESYKTFLDTQKDQLGEVQNVADDGGQVGPSQQTSQQPSATEAAGAEEANTPQQASVGTEQQAQNPNIAKLEKLLAQPNLQETAVLEQLIKEVQDGDEDAEALLVRANDKLDEIRFSQSPASNLPGFAVVNYTGTRGGDAYFHPLSESENAEFKPSKDKLKNKMIKLPFNQVLFTDANWQNSNTLLENFKSTDPRKNHGYDERIIFKPIEKILYERIPGRRSVRLMLGASGAGKSYTTAANLKYLRSEWEKRSNGRDEPLGWKVSFHFAYGTAIIKNGNTLEIQSFDKAWDPAETTAGVKTALQLRNLLIALEQKRFETVINADGLKEKGAVDLLEDVCRNNLIPGFKDMVPEGTRLISQTRNNPRSSRGTIAWKVSIGKVEGGWDQFVIMDLAGNETAYDIINGFFKLDDVRDAMKANSTKTESQIEDELVEAFFANERTLDSLVDEIQDMKHLRSLEGLTTTSGRKRVAITLNSDGLSQMRELAFPEPPPDGYKSPNQAEMKALVPKRNTLELWKYVQRLAKESLYIKFMVAAFAAKLTSGNQEVTEMKHTIPFIQGEPHPTGESFTVNQFVRFCKKDEQFCSNQGVGMYYPFQSGESSEALNANAIHEKHKENKKKLVKQFDIPASDANKIYPIYNLLKPQDLPAPAPPAPIDDIKGVVLLPTHGSVPEAVINSTKYLLRQLLGEYIS